MGGDQGLEKELRLLFLEFLLKLLRLLALKPRLFLERLLERLPSSSY
jgi:hypothetical protein